MRANKICYSSHCSDCGKSHPGRDCDLEDIPLSNCDRSFKTFNVINNLIEMDYKVFINRINTEGPETNAIIMMLYDFKEKILKTLKVNL